jgi:hypothetical protein
MSSITFHLKIDHSARPIPPARSEGLYRPLLLRTQAGKQRQIFLHDNDLGAEIHRRSDVERISGEDHEIELRCCAEQPVKLRQRVMQVGHDQAAHI